LCIQKNIGTVPVFSTISTGVICCDVNDDDTVALH